MEASVVSKPSSTVNWSYSPIMLLPSEVRAPIWAYLPSKDRRSVRQVSKVFKKEIDSTIGLAIDLDERFFDIRNVDKTFPPSASKISIWGSDRTPDYLSRLLYNGRIVTDVTFAGSIDVDLTFKKVITRCPRLYSITVTDHCNFDCRFQIPFKLRNVGVLRLGIREKSRPAPGQSDATKGYLTPVTPWPMYKDVLVHLQLPCLKVFHLEYTLAKDASSSDDYNAVFKVILQYLISHKRISDLTLQLQKAKDAPKTSTAEFEIDFQKESLHYLSLKKLVVSTGPEVRKIWEAILLHQDCLEYLDFLNQGTDWTFFSKLVKNNRRTLETLKLRQLVDVEMKSHHDRVDLGAFEFEACNKLRELLISRFGNSTDEVCLRNANQSLFPFLDRPSSPFPEIIRFKVIPQSVERLQIQGFTVRSDDLLTLAEKAKNLKVLELQLLGYNPGKYQSRHSSYENSFLGLMRQGAGGGGDVGDIMNGCGEKDLVPKDVSMEGFGVSSLVLRELLPRFRNLETLFVEEFYNDHTAFSGDPDLGFAIKKINLIPGEGILKSHGYYGILLGKEPISHLSGRNGKVDRDLQWTVRLNQYRHQRIPRVLGRNSHPHQD